MLHRSIHRIAVLLLAIVLLGGIQAARAAPTSIYLTLGNPSGAVADASIPTNYLIVREQYALSYHRDRGIPNWVSWHLASSDLGSVARYDGNFIGSSALLVKANSLIAPERQIQNRQIAFHRIDHQKCG